MLIRAKDGGSMHRLRYLHEAVILHKFIQQNITANFFKNNKKIIQFIQYKDICGIFCDANAIINHFYVNNYFNFILIKKLRKHLIVQFL